MTFNPDLLESDLIRDEGLKLKPYTDTAGKLTLGVGRNLTDNGISKDEAIYLLRSDVANVEEDLDRHMPWWRDLPEPCARGLANMAFNLGLPRLSTFAIMLANLERKDFHGAAIECLASSWAEQVGQRAERIANLFIEGAEHG